MSTNNNTWCSACRQQINSFALRCPHCTTQLDGWTGCVASPPQQYQPYVVPQYREPTQAERDRESSIAATIIMAGCLWLIYKGCMWLWDCWVNFWNWVF